MERETKNQEKYEKEKGRLVKFTEVNVLHVSLICKIVFQGLNLTFLSTSKVLLVRFFLLAKEGT